MWRSLPPRDSFLLVHLGRESLGQTLARGASWRALGACSVAVQLPQFQNLTGHPRLRCRLPARSATSPCSVRLRESKLGGTQICTCTRVAARQAPPGGAVAQWRQSSFHAWLGPVQSQGRARRAQARQPFLAPDPIRSRPPPWPLRACPALLSSPLQLAAASEPCCGTFRRQPLPLPWLQLHLCALRSLSSQNRLVSVPPRPLHARRRVAEAGCHSPLAGLEPCLARAQPRASPAAAPLQASLPWPFGSLLHSPALLQGS
mmetsp:Transcript_2443/g.7465  ORF Transcript_2443/g.7465 Transcript_2443/m.7465 type:complete len:260 (-) Transcript_2443:158-937(-)